MSHPNLRIIENTQWTDRLSKVLTSVMIVLVKRSNHDGEPLCHSTKPQPPGGSGHPFSLSDVPALITLDRDICKVPQNRC